MPLIEDKEAAVEEVSKPSTIQREVQVAEDKAAEHKGGDSAEQH